MFRLFLLFLLLGAAPRAFALDSAHLELSVAVPNPVTAGDTVNFQGIAVNIGSERWLRDQYYWEAEIYDADKTYIAKTERLQGDIDIASGESAVANLSFGIPSNFGGFYYFRIYFVHKETRLTQSDYVLFRIIERPIVIAPPPPRAAVGGNFVFSYQTPDISDSRSAQATTILNMVGKAGEGTYLLNSNNIHDSTSAWKPYIIYGAYNTAGGSVSLGDVSPNFSALTLASQGMRGVEMMMQPKTELWNRTAWSLVAGRTISALTAGANTNGRYERLVYAGRGTADLWDGRLKTGVSMVLGMDNTASLSPDPKSPKFRGSSLRPQDNRVIGVNFAAKPWRELDVKFDYATSEFTENTELPVPVRGTAMQLQTGYVFTKLSLGASMLRASPKFVSFGASVIAADRISYGLQAAYRPVEWGDIGATVTQFSD
ncbi:hypothetical protein HYW99_01520, partial [Candidatus Woesearchaeota archaeon]|nr:hypothetical protein [Candidatus Woesearchaeota archaeon]